MLPSEVLDIVAEHLIGDAAFATCAKLNVTSKAIHEATLRTLWTHMCFTAYHDSAKYNQKEIEDKWKVFRAARGAKYIRQVCGSPKDRIGETKHDAYTLGTDT